MPFLFCPFFAFFIVVVALIIYAWVQGDKRRKLLAAYAASRGMQFSSEDPFDIPTSLGGFGLMQQGHGKGAANVHWGAPRGFDVMLFEYEYKTGSGKDESTHSHICCRWSLPAPLANMAMRPEGVFDRVAEWFGQNDIDFESEEFSRRYHVTGSDAREVYAVIHPRMMEFIMQSGMEYLEIMGNQALTYTNESTLSPERCDRFLTVAEGFNGNLPPHIVREKGGATNVS